jgi:hypothetical protein
LINDRNAVTNAFKFRNFDDFRNAMSDIISIYEDFKTEFLKLLKEENLPALRTSPTSQPFNLPR